MHALQMVMLKNGLPKDGPQMTGWQQLRVFIFGVFELLVWMKKFKAQVKKLGAFSRPVALRLPGLRNHVGRANAVPPGVTTPEQTPQTAILCNSAFLFPPPSAGGTAAPPGGRSSPGRPFPA